MGRILVRATINKKYKPHKTLILRDSNSTDHVKPAKKRDFLNGERFRFHGIASASADCKKVVVVPYFGALYNVSSLNVNWFSTDQDSIVDIDPRTVCGYNPCMVAKCIVLPYATCVSDFKCRPVFFDSEERKVTQCTGK